MAVILGFLSMTAYAFSERHLIIIRHAECESHVKGKYNSNPKHPHYKPAHLTPQGKKQAVGAAERLLLHGIDNRSIAAVYISPLPGARETAEIIAQYGVFNEDKIYIAEPLIEVQAGDLEGQDISKIDRDKWYTSLENHQKYELETNFNVRKRMLNFYDEVEKKHAQGHVIFITHGVPAMELLQDIVQIEVKLNFADIYLLPFISRTQGPVNL